MASENILIAIDNISTGIADISSGDVTVDLQALAQEVDELRVAVETQGVASIVGQNTNFTDLITALQALNFRCPPLVYKAQVACFDDEPQPQEGVEFEDPPIGWENTYEEQGTSSYYNRKCAVANQIVDSVLYVCGELVTLPVTTMVYGVVVTAIATIVAAFFAGPFAIIVGVGGAIATIATTVVGGLVDFATLIGIANGNRDALVCVTYEAGDAATAKAGFLDIFNSNGATATDIVFLTQLFEYSGMMNNLFFERPDVIPPPSTYETDCTGCDADCPDFRVIHGTQVSQDGNQYTFDSVFIASSPDGYWLSVHFGQDTNGNVCSDPMDLKIISIDQSSNTTAKAYRMSETHFLNGAGEANPNWTEKLNNWSGAINVQKNGVRTITLFKPGGTPFQAVIEIT